MRYLQSKAIQLQFYHTLPVLELHQKSARFAQDFSCSNSITSGKASSIERCFDDWCEVMEIDHDLARDSLVDGVVSRIIISSEHRLMAWAIGLAE